MDVGEEVRGSDPRQPDVILSEQESAALLTPRTSAGRAWIDDHIGPHSQPYYPVILAAPDQVLIIVDRMRIDGLDVGPPEGWESS